MPNLEPIRAYFEERLQAHGASPRGVDWNSATAQEARFAELLKVVKQPGPFSILDYGSGYGALPENDCGVAPSILPTLAEALT